MLQILGLRTFVNEAGETKKFDAFHDKGWRAPSVAELFLDPDKYLKDVPAKERWNLFYTIANCGAGKREFKSQAVLAFDIDGIDTERCEAYIPVVCKALHIDSDKTGIVSSGNGLHFIVGLTKIIRQAAYFKENKHHYKSVCEQVQLALEKARLPGKIDTTVFDARRILRMPNTINRKPDKPEVTARLLQPVITPVDFSLENLSCLPVVSGAEQIDKSFFKKYPRIDAAAVLDGCEFIKHSKAHPASLDEPQWYALLSIVGRLDNGTELAHEYSKGHPGYTAAATDAKLEQALNASGPRTCTNISNVSDACKRCPHWDKVKSPILLVGEGHIATENTGFHNVFFNKAGEITKAVPNYQDLKSFFERVHPYKGLGETGMVHTWTGQQYEYMPNRFLESFAQDHFVPSADTHKVREFRELICRTHLEPLSWFEETTTKRLNFQNGVYDVATGALHPHSPAWGFRYVLPYSYDPEASCPLFSATLDKVVGGDKALRAIIEEYIGYSLSNDEPWTSKAMIFVGGGSNGKSTIVNVIKALAGRGNYAALNMNDLNKSEYNKALLDKKLVNISEETPTKSMYDTSLFKNLVTGGEIQARSPYKEPYFFRSMAKLIFLCNELPDTTDNSYGFYRRFILVPFNQVFTSNDSDFDPHIEAKLLEELPGIFNLAMSGYRRLLKQRGFTKSDVAESALEQYQDDNDTVQAWAKDKINITGNTSDFVSIDDLYSYYKIGTESSGQKPITKNKFSRKLSSNAQLNALRELRKQNGVLARGLSSVQYLDGSGVNVDNVLKFPVGR